jgi:hypothetical protein
VYLELIHAERANLENPMPLSKRTSAAVVAVLGLIMAAVAFAGPASAAPYSDQSRVSVSTQTPAAGSTITLTGTGFGANETVINTLDGTTLASARTDAAGNFSVRITLPAGVTGAHTILSTGATSGHVASIVLTIGAASAASGLVNTGTGTGGLAFTGAAVIGIVALGGLFLAGGFAMVLAGRRRKVLA